MKKTASLLVVLAALFTMSSTFSAEAPKSAPIATLLTAWPALPVTVRTEKVLNILIRKPV